jgi:hypothetical protein
LSLLLAVLPGPLVSAAAPTNETIMLVRSGDDLSELGWSASGTFIDGCQPDDTIDPCWTTDTAHFAGGPFHFVVAQVLTSHFGSHGSFGLRFEGLDRHDGTFAGSWSVIAGSGTGDYLRLTGHGKWTWAEDPGTGNGVFTLVGQVHLL